MASDLEVSEADMSIIGPEGPPATKVTSLEPVSPRGSPRWNAYCERSGNISGKWRRDKRSANWLQRRRWRCDYVEGEVRASE